MKKKSNIEAENGRISSVLGQWEVSAEVPVGFRTEVWNRISRQESPSILTLMCQWLELNSGRRAIVAGYLCVACLIGFGTGLIHVKSESKSFRESMGDRYVKQVDPYLHAKR